MGEGARDCRTSPATFGDARGTARYQTTAPKSIYCHRKNANQSIAFTVLGTYAHRQNGPGKSKLHLYLKAVGLIP